VVLATRLLQLPPSAEAPALGRRAHSLAEPHPARLFHSPLNVPAVHAEQPAPARVANLNPTIFAQALAHGGVEQFPDFGKGVLTGSVIVGQVDAFGVPDPMIPESPVEAV